jgi:hypothetical protein
MSVNENVFYSDIVSFNLSGFDVIRYKCSIKVNKKDKTRKRGQEFAQEERFI